MYVSVLTETLEPVNLLKASVGTKADDKLNQVGVKFISGGSKVHQVDTDSATRKLETNDLEVERQTKISPQICLSMYIYLVEHI